MSAQHPANSPATPTAQRRERRIIAASAITAAIAWPSGLALIVAENARLLDLPPRFFGVAAAWIISLGCLGLGIGMLRSQDPLHAWERGLRGRAGRAGVRTLLGHVATATWVLSVGYTTIIALHTFQVRPVVSVLTLIFCLALAILTTMIAVVAPAKTRLEAAYVLTRDAHERLSADRVAANADADSAARDAMEEGGDVLPVQCDPREMRHVLRVINGLGNQRDASGQ